MLADCYRHPGRPTGLRCTRCDRPACPDCLRTAPVGSHCVDCVREASQGARQPRTFYGARLGQSERVTPLLIAANVVLFLLELGSGGGTASSIGRVGERLALVPVLVAHGDYYRLVSAAFLHAGLLHIGFNMFALYLFGPPLERALGPVRFVALYLVAALGGSTATYLFGPPGVASVGASGAIFGLFGALFVIGRRVGADTNQIVGLIVINLLFGFAVRTIDNRAHLGGLVVGALVAWSYGRASGRRQAAAHVAAVAAIVVVLLVLVAVRTSALRA